MMYMKKKAFKRYISCLKTQYADFISVARPCADLNISVPCLFISVYPKENATLNNSTTYRIFIYVAIVQPYLQEIIEYFL